MKRRTKEVMESMNFATRTYSKIDTSKNGKYMEKHIEEHRKIEKKLFPMKINDKTTIYVTAQHNNEEYKLKWMNAHGYLKKVKYISTKPLGGRTKKEFDENRVFEMLACGFSVSDISKEVNVSTTILYKFFRENDTEIPNGKERVRIFYNAGLTPEEIAKKSKLPLRVVLRHCKHLQ